MGRNTALAAGVLGLFLMLKTNKQLPRGIRNNNPLNIRYNGDQWQGMSGVDDAGFVIFESPEMGFRAAARILGNYGRFYGADTIRKIVARWAPETENDTGAYILSVQARTGIDRDQPISRAEWPQLLAAMVHHENGEQPYSLDTIEAGIRLA